MHGHMNVKFLYILSLRAAERLLNARQCRLTDGRTDCYFVTASTVCLWTEADNEMLQQNALV